MITKKDAAKFWAKYFNADEEEALACHHMTIDCMVKFAREQVKNCSIPVVARQSEQFYCYQERVQHVQNKGEIAIRCENQCVFCKQ